MKRTMMFAALPLITAMVVSAEPIQSFEAADNIADSRVHQQVQIFSDSASVYEAPSRQAKLLGSLAMGTMVKVIARMKASDTTKGFQDAWLKIEANQRGKSMNGYLWGGELAIGSIQLEEKTYFLAGILGMKAPEDPESYEKRAEAKIVTHGKVISRTSFEPVDTVFSPKTYGYEVQAEKKNSKGFSPNVTIIALKFRYEACDYPNGELFFTWNGKQLNTGPEVTVTNSADYVISTSYAYTWPHDREGKTNCLIVKYTETPKDKTQGPKETLAHYRWNGENLAKSNGCH